MFQCVYSIQCLDPEIKEFYIGSTDNFKQRVREHTSQYNSHANYKVYKFMKENGGMSNWEINYIQKFKFLTKEELRVKNKRKKIMKNIKKKNYYKKKNITKKIKIVLI